MPESITFSLGKLPESQNSLYNIIWWQRRVELKPACRAFKSHAKEKVPHWEVPENALLCVDVVLFYPFHCKNGKLKRRDSANMLKLLYDAIAEGLGVDDSRFKAGSFRSVDSEKQWTEVTITILKKETDNE